MIYHTPDEIEALKEHISLCWPLPWNADKKVYIGVDWGYTLKPRHKAMQENPPNEDEYYRNHHGADWYGGKDNEDLVAMAEGKVVFAEWQDKYYGYVVVIEHDFGLPEPYFTKYGHIMEDGFECEVGEIVCQEDLIAFCGTSGNSGANHLHGELLKGKNSRSAAMDIIPFLTKDVDHPIFTSWEGEIITRLQADGRKPDWIVD